MFHFVFAVASRFLCFGNVLQGFARGILALRHLGVISSHLIPTLPPPPPISLLDSSPFAELPEDVISPYPSAGLIAIERIETQAPIFSSPIPSYQSSLMTVTPSQLPNFLPLFIMLAITSGFVILLPAIVMNVAKLLSAFTHASRNVSRFFSSNVAPQIVILLQRCGLLAVQDTRTPILDTIYEQITRCAAGYKILVGCCDQSYEHNEDQTFADCSFGYSHLTHDEQLEKHTLRLQQIYTQFVATQRALLHQLEVSHAREKKSQADLLAAEEEHERLKALIPALKEADKKRRGWEVMAGNAKARCAEAEMTVSKLRADLTAAADRVRHVQGQLDRQVVLTLDKDHVIQSITEESQVARVKLKYAEDKVARLDDKLRRQRDRRLRETKRLLEEQVKVQDCHESEIRRLIQEAQDAREQLDHQAVLASDKDCIIESLTKESQATHVRLKYAEDEFERQNVELRREHDRQLRETKKLSDEQARVQGRHESEISRLAQVAQNAQEQLDRQTVLASDKDQVIQSITEESQAARVRLKSAEDEVERLNAELRRERDRQLRETKQLLDEQVGVQDRHESEMSRLTQEAQNVQEQLEHQTELASDKDQFIQLIAAELRAAHVRLKYAEDENTHLNAKLRLEHDRRLRETKKLLEEQVRVLDHHESEICRLAQAVRNAQEQLDHRAELASDVDRIVQLITEESQAAHVKLKNAEDKVEHLDAELRREHDRRICETKELLDEQARIQDCHETEMRRLTRVAQNAQEQLDRQLVLALDKDHIIQLIAEESQAAHGKLKYAEDKVEYLSAELRRERDRRLCETKVLLDEQARVQECHESEMRRLTEVTQSAQEQSDRYRPSTTWLSDASQLPLTPERIINAGIAQDQRTALEKLPERERQPKSETTQDSVKPNSERDENLLQEELAVAEERCLAEEVCPTGTCTTPSDVAHDPDLQEFDSIHVTVSPWLPRLLDLPLPPSQTCSSPLYLNHPGSSTTPTCPSYGNANCESIESFSLRPSLLPRTFMSERNSVVSMDWPPIGPSLFPAGMNVRQEDCGVAVEVGVRANPDPSLLGRTSPLQKNWDIRDRRSKTPEAPPVLGATPCPLLALPASKRRALTLDREDRLVTWQDRGSLPRLNKLDYGLPEGFVPSFGHIAPRRQAVDFDDFAFVIPLDCPTSTPVASRRRAGLPGLGVGVTL